MHFGTIDIITDPVQVVVEYEQGRGILGVINGTSGKGIEPTRHRPCRAQNSAPSATRVTQLIADPSAHLLRMTEGLVGPLPKVAEERELQVQTKRKTIVVLKNRRP